MKIHITNIYGLGGTAAKATQTVADIAKKTLHFNELGIYHYPYESDSPEMLRTRLDGIMASVEHGDIVIFQVPTWNGIKFDKAFLNRLNAYRRMKRIFFINDVVPLMFESNRYLMESYIELYNQADLLIVPSQKMADFLSGAGLNVQKFAIQRMWDFPVSLDMSVIPQFNRLISFAGKTDDLKFSFAQEWKYDTVRLAVTANKGDWSHGSNVQFMGWFHDDAVLVNALRRNGGFGLLWTENDYCME